MNEIKEFDESLMFCNEFMGVYNKEKEKLPYHINLLEILWANENAHSRILTELLKQNNGKRFEVLESFVAYLVRLKTGTNFTFKFKNPVITAEKDRIDTLIVDKTHALIIENKIHDAEDQEGQLARYILKVISQGINKDNIFVLYLTRDGSKRPEEQTWQFDGNYFQDDFIPRFIEISYKNHILPWVKDDLLPNCKPKDVFLKSTLEQYIDYFEGLFLKRKTQSNMKKELKGHITLALKLNGTLEENNAILESKVKELQTTQDQLNELIEENNQEYWEIWLNDLKKDFPNEKVIDERNETEKNKNIGVELKKYKLKLIIEQDGKSIYFGIRKNHTINQDAFNDLKQILVDFSENDWWFGWKYITSYKDLYSEFKTLIEKVKKALNS